MKKFYLLLLILFPLGLFSQSVRIHGKVLDKNTDKPLEGASITIAETAGGYSDANGAFDIPTENLSPPYKIVIAYIGYAPFETVVENLVGDNIDLGEVKLAVSVLQSDEIVVTGARVSETVQQSSSTIMKVNTQAIRASASGDFYEGLGTLKGVDIVTSSLGFRAFNTRGFNSTSPVRVVQFIDGIDNQAPGLNFPVGNLVGATDIDLQSVEVITGPASALYGPNAFQGVISMTTRNPYDFQGLSLQLKAGNRSLSEAQFRYAKAVGAKKKLAFKVIGSYMSVTDFAATDTLANRYGDIKTTQDLSAILQQQAKGEDSVKYTNLLAYLDFNKNAFPGKIAIQAPGYMEKDLTNYKTSSLKLGGQVAYKIKDSLQISFDYRFGKGTAVYQGTNRYSINNITFHQQKIELTGKHFTVRAYNSRENAGDSYDLVFTGLNLSREGVKNYIGNYLTTYFDTLLYHARGGTSDPNVSPGDADAWMIEAAHRAASNQAGNGAWLKPGSEEFISKYNEIRQNASLSRGSKFTDASSLQHIEGQYNIPTKNKSLNWIAGANFRRYNPQSYGTIFRDTLRNRKDTLENGAANLDADFVNLSVWEVGGYTQASYKLWKDKIALTGSVRADKNQNFNLQFSPRGAATVSYLNHIFRVSAQSAFRIPTLQNQFILLTLAEIPVYNKLLNQTMDFRLEGNLLGHDNLYTKNSVIDFIQHYDSTYEYANTRLKTLQLPKLRPEQVRTLEFGYRTTIKNAFYLDAVAYWNSYRHFIGDMQVVRPTSGAKAGEESGSDALITGNYELLQIPVNSSQKVSSYGAALGLAYYLGKGITPTLNYTYSALNDQNLINDGIIPGFNTPEHKVSVGLMGNKVWKGLGFNINYRYQTEVNWQSTFSLSQAPNGFPAGTGTWNIPAFGNWDMQLSYAFEKTHSTLRIGGSNLLNKSYRTAYGAPLIGRMGYVSWTFDFDKL